MPLDAIRTAAHPGEVHARWLLWRAGQAGSGGSEAA